MLKEDSLRGLAIALIRKDGKILVSPGYDKLKDQHFYRPLGGGIEFGETSEAALKREFLEEIGAVLTDCHLIAVIENIFTYEGREGHEICFIYEAGFSDESLYQREEFTILDSDIDGAAIWVDAEELKKAIFYPEGISKYI